MKYILGTKKEMTQFFSPDGKVYPATIISAGPVVITQVKSKDSDGYRAVQVGYGTQKESRIKKANLGHMKSLGLFRYTKEFRLEEADATDIKLGDAINVSSFKDGDMVVVSGISKSKGFQGVVKRHGFHGGPRTHGQKHSEREPGSIGGGLRNRVPKGMRMAGRTGGDRITIKNLKILAVDESSNQLLVSGAVPGRRGTVLEIIGA